MVVYRAYSTFTDIKPFVTFWKSMSGLFNPVAYCIRRNGIFSSKFIGRNVFLQNLSHDGLFLILSDVVMIDGISSYHTSVNWFYFQLRSRMATCLSSKLCSRLFKVGKKPLKEIKRTNSDN